MFSSIFQCTMSNSSPKSDQMEEHSLSKTVALFACTFMAFFYVAVLHSPTLILRLPPPSSLSNFMIRRFFCAIVSSVISIFISTYLLSLHSLKEPSSAFGIREDYMWHAVIFPLLLTSLIYAGSLVSKFMILMHSWKSKKFTETNLLRRMRDSGQWFVDWILSAASNVMIWRNLVVAPLTEEFVFRACMIPLLLCAGYRIYSVIFFSPIFFSLAHINHFLELYFQKNFGFLRSSLTVGFQLIYTVIFGWYASFLFIRTGHISAPIMAHIFCNAMGLPAFYSSGAQGVLSGLTTFSFVSGLVAFYWLLFPATSPHLYNDKVDSCRCWHGYCNWH